jgi:transposase
MGNDTKVKILISREKGKGPVQIGREINRHYKTVEKFLHRYDLRNSIRNNHQSNNKRIFDPRTERQICRTAFNNRLASLAGLKEMLGLTASRESIRQVLKRNGIRARRPRKKPALTKKQKQDRILWAHQHEN